MTAEEMKKALMGLFGAKDYTTYMSPGSAELMRAESDIERDRQLQKVKNEILTSMDIRKVAAAAKVAEEGVNPLSLETARRKKLLEGLGIVE